MVAGQLVILAPPLIMAVLLTSSPVANATAHLAGTEYLYLAVGLAFALNPMINELRPIVEWVFPISCDRKSRHSIN